MNQWPSVAISPHTCNPWPSVAVGGHQWQPRQPPHLHKARIAIGHIGTRVDQIAAIEVCERQAPIKLTRASRLVRLHRWIHRSAAGICMYSRLVHHRRARHGAFPSARKGGCLARPRHEIREVLSAAPLDAPELVPTKEANGYAPIRLVGRACEAEVSTPSHVHWLERRGDRVTPPPRTRACEPHTCKQKQSVANPWPSVAISGHQWPSMAIRGHL